MHILLHALSLFQAMCQCTEYKLSALQVRIGGKYTQPYDTAVHNCKNIICALKHGSKTHSSLRQSKLQLQNQAALMSRRIRAVEHRKSAAGLTVRTSRFTRSNLAKLHKNWECS